MREDWVEIELGKVCQINMGQSPPSSTYNTEKNGLAFFQGKAEFTELHPVAVKWCTEPKKIANKGDILLSVRAPVGSTNIANQKCAIGRGLAAISFKYSNSYLWYYLKSIEKKLDSQGTGTTFKAVSGNVLKSQVFPLPPLPIQRAIVHKIENLFASLDKGITDLKKAQEQLKVYRQAVLKKAFEGELTKEWREEHVKTDGRPSHIPMAAEPTITYKKQGAKKLPEGWRLVELGGLIEKPKYGTSKKCTTVDKGYGVLRIPNIVQGFVDSSDLKYAQFSKDELKTYELKEGDILTIRSNGSVSIVGKCALIRKNDTKFLYAGYLIRLRPFKEYISSEYLLHLLSSFDLRVQIELKAKSTSGVNNINSGEIQSLNVPLPVKEEQHQIVREIESRLSVCDKVEQNITEGLKKSEALRQSILKKAFEGKLLSETEIEKCKQEADYEPAGALLERIKKEKDGK